MTTAPTIPSPPSSLEWLAVTVQLEAGGEPYLGKLAVAWSIVNRAERRKLTISDAVMAAWQFSAWNTDSPRRLALDNLEPAAWAESFRAACAALFDLAPDPTGGADHYLNVAATRAGRADGLLPSWARDPANPKEPNPEKITAVIGAHTFLKLEA